MQRDLPPVAATRAPDLRSVDRIAPHRLRRLGLHRVCPPVNDVVAPAVLGQLRWVVRMNRCDCRIRLVDDVAVLGRHRIITSYEYPVSSVVVLTGEPA